MAKAEWGIIEVHGTNFPKYAEKAETGEILILCARSECLKVLEKPNKNQMKCGKYTEQMFLKHGYPMLCQKHKVVVPLMRNLKA